MAGAVANIITVGLNPAVDRVIQVENLALGGHQVGRLLRRAGAGKSINVSRVLAALGVPSAATGFLGQDSRDDFAAVFEGRLIRDEFLYLPGRTRENITLVDPVAGQETHIRDVGLPVTPADVERLAARLAGLAGAGAVVVFSGSLPPGIAPAEFARLLDACAAARLSSPKSGGGRIAVDTSGPALEAIRDRRLWLVKPNVAELAQLYGGELPTADDQLSAARELTRQVEIVLLSRGEQGAILVTTEGAWQGSISLPSRTIVSTVGCGDALLGAFLAGSFRGLSPPEALRDAVACAAASACTPAAAEFDLGLCQELREKVEIGGLS